MRYLLLILFTFCSLFVSAQDKTSTKTMLQVSKKGASVPVILPIKENRRLKVKTSNGEKITFKEYVLLGDSAIASPTDTILLKEVKSIRASAQITGLKNFLGAAFMGVGVYFTVASPTLGWIPFLFTGNPVYVLLWIPGMGLVYWGAVLKGIRKFNTERWELAIVPRPE